MLAMEPSEVAEIGLPVVAVLGNHDYHSDTPDEVAAIFGAKGLHVLTGRAIELDVAGCRLGIAGSKGFGVGFVGASGNEFGEPETKIFMERPSYIALKCALKGE